MKFLVIFSCIVAVTFAKPGFIAGYAAFLPGAPLGPDGRVVDTPAVAFAKAEHAAAHLNERLNLNREALRSADYLIPAPVAAPIAYAAQAAPLAYTAAFAPAAAATILATDPRPRDTPEVALAKAEHAAVHAQETIRNLAYA